MIGTGEQLFKKIDEASRLVGSFNAAGIAGAIAVLDKTGWARAFIIAAGMCFIIGIFASAAEFIFSMSGPPQGNETPSHRDLEIEMKRMVIALYTSGSAFIIGVLFAFIGVILAPPPAEPAKAAALIIRMVC